MPDVKAVSDIKRLEEQLGAAKETARAGFLASANESLEQLRAIGYEYELTPVGKATEAKGSLCGKCGERGHNARGCQKGGSHGVV